MKRVTTMFISVVGMASMAHAAGTVDFNDPGDLANLFTWAAAGSNQYFAAVSNGVANSGGVAAGGVGNIWATYNEPTDPFSNVGDSITNSIDFKWKATNLHGSFQFLKLGLSDTLAGLPVNNYASIALRAMTTTNQVRLEASVSTYWDNNGPTATLTDGEWYRLEGTYERIESSGSPRFQFSLELFGLGPDGTGAPTSLATYSLSQGTLAVNAPLYEDPLYQEFMAYQAFAGGAEAVDNYYSSNITVPLREIGDIVINPLGNSNVVVAWTAEAIGTYSLQFKQDLGMNLSWSNLITNIQGVDGTLSVTTDTANVQSFYRVVGE